MLRTHWQYSAKGAVAYLAAADYYASSPGELLGKGFEHLDISGMSARDVFECLCHNLDPKTGEKLRPLARDGERIGMDFTFNSTKSVGIARELAGPDNAGDPRIEQAHREAVAYAMSFVERDMQTRVRGGRDGDRVTGNLMAYRVTHRDTRISPEDNRPDMSLHDHCFVLNVTYDPEEKRFKAAQIGQIKHDAPYYEAVYHNRLAANLRELGYGVRKKDKAFEISGVSDELVKKFSRRTQQIKEVAAKIGASRPETLAKLGATTRLGKVKELADDLNGYYVSRLTEKEKQQLADLEGKPSYVSSETEAVQFAVGHLFERQSVAEERKLYETAIRHGIGSVTPEGIEAEAKRQGVLLKAGEATTRDVLAEESRIIAFAREGRGTMRPLRAGVDSGRAGVSTSDSGRVPSLVIHGPLHAPLAQAEPAAATADTATPAALGQQKGRPDESRRPERILGPQSPVKVDSNPATLSPEQQAAFARDIDVVSKLSAEQQAVVRHVWDLPDQVILIRGAAGTGKTTTTRAIISGIDRPYAMLAPTAEASRGVLRREGFEGADTVAAFLGNRDWQNRIKGGVLLVDEAGLLPIRDLSTLTDVARAQNARLVLMGDPKQHKSVARHGNMFRVLQEYAGVPVAELRDIRRQRGQYKQAVAAIDRGEFLKAHDLLDDLGCIRQAQDDKPLVNDYLDAVNRGKSVLVVAPTHAEGDEITAEIRKRLKEEGKLAAEEKVFEVLKPLNWTVAERADVRGYSGGEVLQLHRNAGPWRAGQKLAADSSLLNDRRLRPDHFSVYRVDSLRLGVGDAVRVTANGWTRDRRHKLNNGAAYTVAGFTKDGDLQLDNGWIVGKDFGHLTHGYVSTSHAAQGKTVDRVLIAMGSESIPAISAEQFYVSVSRGRERATIFTDLAPAQLRDAIQKQDARKSATELLTPLMKPDIKSIFFKRRIELYKRHRRDQEREATQTREKERYYGR